MSDWAADRRAALLAALAWQIELGADEAIGVEPVDRTGLGEPPRPKREARAMAPAAARRAAPRPAADPAESARATASAAADLAGLRAALEAFEGSRLKMGAKSCVFADGDPRARVMVIGEAPGAEEDRQGLPFVGRSGALLDRMLAAIGLSRHSDAPEKGAYITNVVPYRPLGNRTPDDAEVAAFAPFVLRHIALAAPDCVVCLGNAPAKHVMGATVGVTRFRGTWRDLEIEGRRIPALATFHPAFLLRSPEMKRLAWRDLLSLAERLDGA